MFPRSRSDALQRSARQAAGAPNVRQAIRELTLQALCGRALSTEHIVCVARTVGEGIASCELPPTAPVRDTHGGAWAGLEDAVEQALLALEVATREFADSRPRLAPGERRELLDEVDRMQRALAERWQAGRSVPATLRTRMATVTSLLESSSAAPPENAADLVPEPGAKQALEWLAGGVLLGLFEAQRRTAVRRGN